MPFDPENPEHVSRLQTAVDSSYAHLKTMRENRVAAIRQFVGTHYSGDGSTEKVPIQLLGTAVNVYMRHLVAQAPQVLATTANRDLKAYAATMKVGLNRRIKEVDLEAALQQATLDAIFSYGICRVGITCAHEDRPKTFVERISPDHWVHDVGAPSLEDAGYMGFRYRAPKEEVLDNGVFNKKARDELAQAGTSVFNEGDEEWAENISRESGRDPNDFRDYVDLRDIWVPESQVLLTYPVSGGKVLHTIEWDGPRHGPFLLLGFDPVPDNILPLSPIALLMDLHTFGNQLFLKTARQGLNAKTVTGYEGGAADDARRVTEAADLAMIRMDKIGRIEAHKYGGMDPQNLALFLQAKKLFSDLGGNLDLLGGLGPQAETLGQDEMLIASASKRLSQMQAAVTKFTKKIIYDLAWWDWHDPMLGEEVFKPTPRRGGFVKAVYGGAAQVGDFPGYDFDIVPFSMQDRSPQERMQFLIQFVQQVILPIMPVLAQRGVVPDFVKFIQDIAELSGSHELQDMLMYFHGQPGMQGGGGQMSAKPPVTERRNVRINRPGATPQGADDVLSRLMMGGRSQPSEGAALGRMTG